MAINRASLMGGNKKNYIWNIRKKTSIDLWKLACQMKVRKNLKKTLTFFLYVLFIFSTFCFTQEVGFIDWLIQLNQNKSD